MSNLPTLLDANQSVVQYITFKVGNELFGVDIQSIEEIIFTPNVTGIPRTPDYFLGIANLRGEVISIIDLRIRFHQTSKTLKSQRVIVIVANGLKLGMLVDHVSSIISIPNVSIMNAPPLAMSGQRYVVGSYKMENEELLLILDHAEIISKEDFTTNFVSQEKNIEAFQFKTEEEEVFSEVYLVGFSIGREHYAISGLVVNEIIEVPPVTSVPEMGEFIEGIFQLRNHVIPLIRLADRLNLHQPREHSNEFEYPVIIVNIFGILIGLVVEEITEVFHVFENEIEPPPTNLNQDQVNQLEGIIKLKRNDQTRMIMLLNHESIFTNPEKKFLEELNKRNASSEERKDIIAEVEEKISILEFKINHEYFSIPIETSNEIISMKPIIPVPQAPPFIKGVINLRGNVISVINLPALIHGKESPITKKTKILIIEHKEEIAGLIVDELVGIKSLNASTFQKPSELIKQKGNVFIQGIGKQDNRIIVLIDLEKTLIQAQTHEKEVTYISSSQINQDSIEAQKVKPQKTEIEQNLDHSNPQKNPSLDNEHLEKDSSLSTEEIEETILYSDGFEELKIFDEDISHQDNNTSNIDDYQQSNHPTTESVKNTEESISTIQNIETSDSKISDSEISTDLTEKELTDEEESLNFLEKEINKNS